MTTAAAWAATTHGHLLSHEIIKFPAGLLLPLGASTLLIKAVHLKKWEGVAVLQAMLRARSTDRYSAPQMDLCSSLWPGLGAASLAIEFQGRANDLLRVEANYPARYSCGKKICRWCP